MKNLKRDLDGINKDLKTLAKKVDKMIAAVGKLEKPKAKAVKAKPAKKTPVKVKPAKKTPVKAKPVKKSVAKKTTAKKTVKLTAADTVFNCIKRFKKGVDTSGLKERTGFKDHKIHNIVYKLKNEGKIKSAGRGLYVKV
jgi:ElaB/YqjD/DUF883 family membrane-anchored ribosome-binding protein